MISAVTGILQRVDDERVDLAIGPVTLDVLIPAADAETLRGQVGETVTFHTMFYLEGDASGGNATPRLIGFKAADDKAFFALFITTKGIGPRKALRALVLPIGEIALAIEQKDTRVLGKLPGIGKRTAETIAAELSGKVGRFVVVGGETDGQRATPNRPAAFSRLTAIEADAIATLVALGDREPDARRLLDRFKDDGNEVPASTDALVQALLRARGGR